MGITRIDDAFRSYSQEQSETLDVKQSHVATPAASPLPPPVPLKTVQPLQSANVVSSESAECPQCNVEELFEALQKLERSVKAHHDTTILTVAIIVIALVINTAFVWYCFTTMR